MLKMAWAVSCLLKGATLLFDSSLVLCHPAVEQTPSRGDLSPANQGLVR